MVSAFFFFNDPATTEIYTLSLHDALPILGAPGVTRGGGIRSTTASSTSSIPTPSLADRKSTRLNSSHLGISYAVFCLKKKKNTKVESCYHLVYHQLLVVAAYVNYVHSLTP